MTREDILKDPEVAHYCDAKRGWVHEAFMDGVDYAERKMGSTIKWQAGEPKEECTYLVTFEYEGGRKEICITSWSNLMKGFRHNREGVRHALAWCKLSDIEPYKEEQP